MKFLELLVHARGPVEVSGMKTPIDEAGAGLAWASQWVAGICYSFAYFYQL